MPIQDDRETYVIVETPLEHTQRRWTGLIGFLFGITIWYYYQAVVKGPMGKRMGVILSWFIGVLIFVLASPPKPTANGMPTGDQFIAVLILIFGGVLLGPLGERAEQIFRGDKASWGISKSGAESSLMSDEQIVFQTKLHWWMWAWPVPLVCIILIGLRAVMDHAYSDAFSRQYTEELTFLNTIMAAAFLAGFVPIVLLFVSWLSSGLSVTNRRVIVKFGVIRRQAAELILPQIETCVLSVPLMGQLFGYRNVQLEGSDGTSYPLRYVVTAEEFRDHILEQKRLEAAANPSTPQPQIVDKQPDSQPIISTPAPRETQSSSVSAVDKLEKELAKLDAMRQKGILDEDEYKALKKKIISKA